LHRLPYVDKKPLDLYKLKKAVESRGGFEKVCKGKKWAEIGRDLGYSGKIMSSLSTSLKNSFQKWLWPYEEYLRVAKPGVHQQLEAEYGGPLTPSPAVTPMRRSNANTPMSLTTDSPARQASDMLQSTVNGVKKELERDVSMTDAPPVIQPTSGFTAVNTGGFTAVNSNANSNRPTPDVKRADSPASGLGAAAIVKRKLSTESSSDSSKKEKEKENGIDSSADINRRSKRLKKGKRHF
jgi:[histone H3]-trimethyl-L-lysine4 demethylase